MPFRLAIVISHPIQYFTPYFRALANHPDLDVHVLYASRFGLDATLDVEMGVHMAWATDLLEGYSSEFLPGAETITSIGFRSVDNPAVGMALKRFAPDVVLLYGYASKTMLRALLWCRLHRIPAMMSSDSSSHVSPPGLRRRLKTMVLPLLLGQYSAMLTLGDKSDAYLRGLGVPASRIFRVPAMIDAAFWRGQESRESERERLRAVLHLPQDAIVAIAVSKLVGRKRVGDAVEAIAIAAKSGNPLVLVVVGDGELRSDLEAQARRLGVDARFVGFKNIDEIASWYAMADLFVHPAGEEQFGMVLIEAAILGLPQIVSDAVGGVGPTAAARPDFNALIYPCGDSAALARAISTLCTDTQLRARMAAASLEVAKDHTGGRSVAGTMAAITKSVKRTAS